jgi:Fur family transcriptional regulator, stress-responsive regulator
MIIAVQLPTAPVELLRRHGVRVTAQRLAVLRAVGRQPHGTAHDVAAIAEAEIGAISHQAVYDALGVLVEKGILRRIQPVGAAARYEHRTDDDHHHMVCRACDSIVDVAPVIDAAAGPAPAGGGFEVDWAEVIYWGLCPACQVTNSSA